MKFVFRLLIIIWLPRWTQHHPQLHAESKNINLVLSETYDSGKFADFTSALRSINIPVEFLAGCANLKWALDKWMLHGDSKWPKACRTVRSSERHSKYTQVGREEKLPFEGKKCNNNNNNNMRLSLYNFFSHSLYS